MVSTPGGIEKSPKGLPGFLRRSLRLNEDEEEELQRNAPMPGVDDGSSELSPPSSGNLDRPPIVPRVKPAPSTNQNNGGASSPIPPPKDTKTGLPMATPNPSPAVHKATSPLPPPLNEEHHGSWAQNPPNPPLNTANTEEEPKTYKERQFESTITAEVVSMAELRKLSWNGIPPDHRAQAWKLMLGYVPANSARRKATLHRKRAEYKDAIAQHYDIDDDTRTIQEQETLRQVLVDVPRTAPDVMLFRNDKIRKSLSRLLYIWAMRHPASSYVQGINDLATPLIVVFLNDYFPDDDVLDGKVMDRVSEQIMEEVSFVFLWESKCMQYRNVFTQIFFPD